MELLDTPLEPINIFLRSSEYTSTDIYKSNLTFELNKPILPYPNMDVLIGLESFQFTNSFYTVNETNCNFSYNINNGITTNILLSFGNYDIDTFMTYLNATVTNLLFSYNTSTLRITIATKNNMTINLLPISNNAYELLGFSDSGTSSNSNSILAPYMFNLISVQVLHVCTSNIVLNSYGLKNKTKRNIIGSVQVTSSSGEVQTFTSSFKNKIHTDPISSITISIFNQDFNTVNFNNIDWFINLSFSFCYRKKLEMPQYLNTINLESQMQYYIEEEESRNKNKVLDSLLDKKN
jgi:hypothetical protein